MIKITIIGAGSSVFTKNIVTDILLMKEFKNIEFSLMDIDEKRLKTSYQIVYQISKKLGVAVNIKSRLFFGFLSDSYMFYFLLLHDFI